MIAVFCCCSIIAAVVFLVAAQRDDDGDDKSHLENRKDHILCDDETQVVSDNRKSTSIGAQPPAFSNMPLPTSAQVEAELGYLHEELSDNDGASEEIDMYV